MNLALETIRLFTYDSIVNVHLVYTDLKRRNLALEEGTEASLVSPARPDCRRHTHANTLRFSETGTASISWA